MGVKKGDHLTDEHKRKIGLGNMGKKRQPPSYETRLKISLANKGRVKSEEERRKLSIANTGKIHLEETRRKLSLANRGRKLPPRSEEYRRKISLRMTGRIISDDEKERLRSLRKGQPGFWKGKVKSEEHRRKLGLSHKGKIISEEDRQKKREASIRLGIKPPSWLGKKHTEDSIKKMKEVQSKPRPWNRRENSNHWKGGTTPQTLIIRHSFETKTWRKSVFEKDNWTCQKCLEKGKRLHCHHNKNFSEAPGLRFEVDNGTTLCVECHNQFHKIFGTSGNTPEQMRAFL